MYCNLTIIVQTLYPSKQSAFIFLTILECIYRSNIRNVIHTSFQIGKKSISALILEEINLLWCIHTVEYYITMKRNVFPIPQSINESHR